MRILPILEKKSSRSWKEHVVTTMKNRLKTRFAELELVDKMPDELWQELEDIVKEE